MRVYKERTTGYLTATCLDADNAPQVPVTLQYRIDCLTSGQVVRDWTAVVPAAAAEIVLTASDNAMRNAANRSEHRRVTVFATYGVDDEVRNICEYYVENLAHVG